MNDDCQDFHCLYQVGRLMPRHTRFKNHEVSESFSPGVRGRMKQWLLTVELLKDESD